MPPINPPVARRGGESTEVTGAIDDLDEDYFEAEAPLSDDEITVRVRRALRTDAATSMLRVLVSTEDGVVTLRGQVQTYDDSDNAIDVASRIPNVIDVVDELDIEA